MNAALNISVMGIHRNIERFNAAAAEIAKFDKTADIGPLVDQIIASHSTEANINTFRAAARMERALLDILA